MNNDITINVLSVENRDIYICRKGIRREVVDPTLCRDHKINLLVISEGGIWHYTTIKSLSRLLNSRNSKHHGKQHFCMNCLQGFTLEWSRDEHYAYCNDKEMVRVEMPKLGSVVEFCDGQNQFKVPFIMYADFESVLEPIQGPENDEPCGLRAHRPHPRTSSNRGVNNHIPSGWCIYSDFTYGKVENPLKLYRGEDCVKKFCDHVIGEAHRLYHAFPEKPMEPLTKKQWKKYKKTSRCHICFESFTEDNPKVRAHCHYSGLYRGAAHSLCNLR